MKQSELINDDISLYIDESESTISLTRDDSKRTSWTPIDQQEFGLPPTGKRIDSEHSNGIKNSNRVRMRTRPPRAYQLQAPSSTISLVRPISFNERFSSVRLTILSILRDLLHLHSQFIVENHHHQLIKVIFLRIHHRYHLEFVLQQIFVHYLALIIHLLPRIRH